MDSGPGGRQEEIMLDHYGQITRCDSQAGGGGDDAPKQQKDNGSFNQSSGSPVSMK